MQTSLDSLIAEAQEGVGRAKSELWSLWHAYIWKFAVKMWPYLDEDEIHDRVLEAECQLWGNLDKYQPDKTFQAWLTTVIRNKFLTIQDDRHTPQMETLETVIEETYDPFEDYANRRELEEVLRRVPSRYRLVAIEIFTEGRSHEEFARNHNLSTKYVHYRLVPEAKRALREAFDSLRREHKTAEYQERMSLIQHRSRYDPGAPVIVVRRPYEFDTEHDYMNRPYCWRIFG